MKIPEDAIIPPEKFTKYLLIKRPRDDKSLLLGKLGFTLDLPEVLEAAIRSQVRHTRSDHGRNRRLRRIFGRGW